MYQVTNSYRAGVATETIWIDAGENPRHHIVGTGEATPAQAPAATADEKQSHLVGTGGTSRPTPASAYYPAVKTSAAVVQATAAVAKEKPVDFEKPHHLVGAGGTAPASAYYSLIDHPLSVL